MVRDPAHCHANHTPPRLLLTHGDLRMSTPTRRRHTPADPWLDLSDALVEIGITRATWYRWRNRGYGPEAKRTQTGRIRVRRSVLDAFLDGMDAA